MMGVQGLAVVGAVLAMVLSSGVHALETLPHHARGGLAWRLHAVEPVGSVAYEFDQMLDHSGRTTTETFKQRYFVNDTFFDASSGPVFLHIGGEGPCNGPYSGYLMDLAQAHRGLVIAVEHRFYGQSVPANGLAERLEYLTVDQALADLKHLSESYATEHKIRSDAKWIACGGSYSGALSAWYRIRYPDRCHASIASSAVVNAIEEFVQFDEHVAKAIGSECDAVNHLMVTAFDDMIASGNGAEAKAMFNAPELSDDDFRYMIADSLSMADQYGNKAALCSAMAKADPKSPSSLRDTFAHFTNTFWGASFGSGCFYSTKCLQTEQQSWQPTARAWRWQKCHELAYLQSAPHTHPLRSPHLTHEALLAQCHAVFGDHVSPQTARINMQFGGAHPIRANASRIFFSDFSDDPWTEASVLETESPSLPYSLVLADGVGHCGDMHAPMPSDPVELTHDRAEMNRHLSLWLNE